MLRTNFRKRSKSPPPEKTKLASARKKKFKLAVNQTARKPNYQSMKKVLCEPINKRNQADLDQEVENLLKAAK